MSVTITKQALAHNHLVSWYEADVKPYLPNLISSLPKQRENYCVSAHNLEWAVSAREECLFSMGLDHMTIAPILAELPGIGAVYSRGLAKAVLAGACAGYRPDVFLQDHANMIQSGGSANLVKMTCHRWNPIPIKQIITLRTWWLEQLEAKEVLSER